MRLLLGMILGSLLTVGGAYIADQRDNAADPHPMVNWDVVQQKLAVIHDASKEIRGTGRHNANMQRLMTLSQQKKDRSIATYYLASYLKSPHQLSSLRLTHGATMEMPVSTVTV